MKKYAYIGCLGFIAVITTEFGVIGILPQIAGYYQISIDTAGLLLSLFALVIALTGPFMTLLTAGIDRKKIMMAAISLFLLTGLISACSPPFWLLVLARILPALLQPVYIAAALSVAVSKSSRQQENEQMGIVFSGVAIAMVVTVPFATWLADRSSWEYAFMLQAVVSAIALLVIYFGLPDQPVTHKKSYGSQLKILVQPVFLISTAMNFFMIAAWFSVYSYFASYLQDAKGMDPAMISYMMFTFGIVGIAANRVSGKMLNKNITRTVALFLSGTLLIPVLLLWAGQHTIALFVVIALWGFLYAPSFLNASAYMISAAPQSLEFANSLATSFGNMGIAVGTTAGGWIIATRGVQYTPWLTLVLGGLAFLMVVWRKVLEQKERLRAGTNMESC